MGGGSGRPSRLPADQPSPQLRDAVAADILQLARAAGFGRVRLYRLSSNAKSLVGEAQLGISPAFVGKQWAVEGNRDLGVLLNSPQPMRFKGAGQGQEFGALLRDSDVKGDWAWLPLRVKGKSFGGVIIDGSRGRNAADEDLSSLTSFLAHAVEAAENERSLKLLERKARNLNAVLHISTRVNSSLNLSQILRVTCQSAKELLGVDHSGFVLFNSDMTVGEVYAEFPDMGAVGKTIPLQTKSGEQFLSSKQPLIIFDVKSDTSLGDERTVPLELGIQSTLIMPVVGKRRILGSFGLDSINRKRKFSDDEIEVCRIFAEQVAVAIENAQTYDAARQKAEQAERVREKSSERRSQLLYAIVERAVRSLKAKSGGIYQLVPGKNVLTVVVDYNRQVNIGKTLKIGEGMAGQLVRSGKPFMIVDDYNTWEYKAHIYTPSRKFGAVIEVPLSLDGAVSGVIYIDDDVGRKFTPEDARLLGLFADQAAIALHNADILFSDEGEWQQQVKLSKATMEIMDNLRTATLEERLNLIAKSAANVLEAESCGVFLVKDGALSLEASYGHREGGFKKGMRLPIRSAPGGGLNSHIAHTGKAFRMHGDALKNHFAVGHIGTYHTPSRECYSILAVPLYEGAGDRKKLIGLLRADNKRSRAGKVSPALYFTHQDEWIIKIFADAAVVAIGSTIFVEQLRQTQRSLSDIVGLLNIGDQRENVSDLSQKEIDLVEGVTAQTKNLLERLKLFKEQEQLLTKISKVKESAEIVASLTALGVGEETLKYVAEGTQSVLGSDVVILYTYDQLKGKLNYPPVYAGALLSNEPWLPSEIPRHSISYKMLEEDDVYIVNSIATDADFRDRPFSKREKIKSCVASPLIAMGRKVGVMFVNYRRPHNFTPDEINNIKFYVNQAAVAIYNAQLYKEAHRRARALEALNSAGQAMTSSLRLKTTLDEITSQALWIVGEAGGEDCFSYVSLLGERGFDVVSASPELMLSDVRKKLSKVDISRPNEEIGIMGLAAKTETSQNVGNVQRAVGYIEIHRNVNSQLSVPLKIGSKVIGVLSIEHPKCDAFSPEDQRNIESLAAQAAVAIQNAENYEATRRDKERLENLHKAARSMAGEFELKNVLKTVVERAKEVLGADSSILLPYEHRQCRFIPNEPVCAGIPDPEFRRIVTDESVLSTAEYVLRKGWVSFNDRSARASNLLSPSACSKLRRAGVTASQAIALQTGEESVGVLFVNYKQRRAFNDEDRQHLEGFASYAGLALKKARLLRQVEVASLISDVVAQLTALGDKTTSLLMIVGGAQAAAGSDAVVMYIYDHITRKLEPQPVCIGVEAKAVRHAPDVTNDAVIFKVLKRSMPYLVESVDEDPLFRNSRFVRAGKFKSCLALPLSALGQKVGVMFLNYKTPRCFTSDEIKNIHAYAHQVSVVVSNAQTFEQSQRRARVLEGLYEAGQAVTGSLRLKTTLDEITSRALEIVGEAGDGDCFSHAALLKDGGLDFISASPKKYWDVYMQRLASPERGRRKRRLGIAGRAAKTGQVLNIGNVHKDKDYDPVTDKINSQLSVPLKVLIKTGGRERKKVIGVLTIEHPEHDAFSIEDQRNIELLAAQAAVAVHNAEQFEELERTKGLVGSRTALAWMGMTSNVWRHAIEGHATNIKNALVLLRDELSQESLSELHLRLLERRLRVIEKEAEKILKKDIAPPYASSDGIELISLNDFIRDRNNRLRENEVYPEGFNVELKLDGDNAHIRCNRNWLREAFDIIVENAVEATEDVSPRRLTISTQIIKSYVEISFTDTGKGMPPDVYANLFKKRILRRRTRGLGVGLLMVQAIVQAYGGDIRATSPGPGNTCLVIQFPLQGKKR